MRHPLPLLAAALLLAAPGARARAATLLEAKIGTAGTVQKSWVAGDHARVETAGRPGYLIQDLAKGRLYLVSPRERTVLNMSETLKRRYATAPPGARIVAHGAGPQIAGYATRRYTVMLHGRVCASYDLAPKLAHDTNLRRYARAFARRALPHAAVPSPGSGGCAQAEQAFGMQLARHGFPLRMSRNGSERFEVVRVAQGATVPAGFFALPKRYPVIAMDTLLRGLPQPAAGNAPPKGGHGGPRIDVHARERQLKKFDRLIGQQRSRH